MITLDSIELVKCRVFFLSTRDHNYYCFGEFKEEEELDGFIEEFKAFDDYWTVLDDNWNGIHELAHIYITNEDMSSFSCRKREPVREAYMPGVRDGVYGE